MDDDDDIDFDAINALESAAIAARRQQSTAVHVLPPPPPHRTYHIAQPWPQPHPQHHHHPVVASTAPASLPWHPQQSAAAPLHAPWQQQQAAPQQPTIHHQQQHFPPQPLAVHHQPQGSWSVPVAAPPAQPPPPPPSSSSFPYVRQQQQQQPSYPAAITTTINRRPPQNHPPAPTWHAPPPPPQQQQQPGPSRPAPSPPTHNAQQQQQLRKKKDLYSLWGTSRSQELRHHTLKPPPLAVLNQLHHVTMSAKVVVPGYEQRLAPHAHPRPPQLQQQQQQQQPPSQQPSPYYSNSRVLQVCHEAAQHWVYPLGVPEREYQITAIQMALLKNTLVCLPTGLGKTLIAAVVMHNFTRWFPTSKIVFVAPTRPLVSQQIDACRRFMGLDDTCTAELTGRIKAEDRKLLWRDESRRIFFCTPQTFYNDVKLAVCPYDEISCVVVDECHRATGQSEIAQTLRTMRQKYKLKFRVVGLSATPGGSAEAVQEVLSNLGTEAVVFRSETDADVAPYVFKKATEVMVVETEESRNGPRGMLLATLQRIVGHLAGAKLYWGSADAERVTRFGLQQAQNQAKGQGGAVPSMQAAEWFRQAMVLADVRDSFDRYGVLPTVQLVHTKMAEERCLKSLKAKEAMFSHFITKLHESASSGGGGPRLAALVSLLRRHFQSDGTPGGVIVFATLRDGVQNIVDALQQHAPLLRARAFVGQGAASGSGRSRGTTGMNQKEQKDAVKGFAQGTYNVLVATCIGEEGLDIPAVDLIVCYDATASPTRVVQRHGRTGRHREGKVVYILGAGKEEEHYYKIQDSTTKLHGLLRHADRYFELAAPGAAPRMLPRQYIPTRLDVAVSSSSSSPVDAAGVGVDGEVAGEANGGGGGGGGGHHHQKGRRKTNVMALLEAGGRRLAQEGRRYPVGIDVGNGGPSSPLPSQPNATQVDSPAPPHRLLFPDATGAFIKPGSNGRRLAVGPPSAQLLQKILDVNRGGRCDVDDVAPDEPDVRCDVHCERARFLPEIVDDGDDGVAVVVMPCGRKIECGSVATSPNVALSSSPLSYRWMFLAASIAKSGQKPEKSDNAKSAGAGRKRKGRGGGGGAKKKMGGAGGRDGPKPTPPAALLALADVYKEGVETKNVEEGVDGGAEEGEEERCGDGGSDGGNGTEEQEEEKCETFLDLVDDSDTQMVDCDDTMGEDEGQNNNIANDKNQDVNVVHLEDTPSQENLAQRLPHTNAATNVDDINDDDVPLAVKKARLLQQCSTEQGIDNALGKQQKQEQQQHIPCSSSWWESSSGDDGDDDEQQGNKEGGDQRQGEEQQVVVECPVEEDDWGSGGYGMEDGGIIDYNDEYNGGGDDVEIMVVGAMEEEEKDELWEEWQKDEEEEQPEDAAQPPPRHPHHRRFIISSQSQSLPSPNLGTYKPQCLGSASTITPPSLHGTAPQQQQQQRSRLRKAGDALNKENTTEQVKKKKEKKRNGKEHDSKSRPHHHHHHFLDTEAQLSGDDDDDGGGDDDGNDGAYESDFIDDGTPIFQSGGGGGGRGGGPSLPSPSPMELLRRLQRARLGRRSSSHIKQPYWHNRSAPYNNGATTNANQYETPPPQGTASDYDREDSFINDDDDDEDVYDEDDEEGGAVEYITPGRGTHADECERCNGEDGELLLCDACPGAYHLACVGLTEVPTGDWFCPLCCREGRKEGGNVSLMDNEREKKKGPTRKKGHPSQRKRTVDVVGGGRGGAAASDDDDDFV